MGGCCPLDRGVARSASGPFGGLTILGVSDDDSFAEKLRSLSFSRPRHRSPKRMTDELGNTVTEHWNDRVDVHIGKPQITVNPALVAKEMS